MATTYNIKITCETEGAEIRYESSGSADTVPADPTESSTLYSSPFGLAISSAGTQIKARGFKSGYEPSDVAIKTIKPVTVPMALPDGSVLFYDRGSTYGEYSIGADGYPVRLSSGEDDGSPESTYWRYLICDKSDLEGTKQWGPYGTLEFGEASVDMTSIGTGFGATFLMCTKYGGNQEYFWAEIVEKFTNNKWFTPSKDELNLVYQNKNAIVDNGGDAFKTDTAYWSSSEDNSRSVWRQYFSTGSQGYSLKNTTLRCRLLKRI